MVIIKNTVNHVRQHDMTDWVSMDSAPKDGTPVLLKFKDDLSAYKKDSLFAGIQFVGRSYGNIMEWSFAAPVGVGGFPDNWLEGWQPLPSPPKENS